MQTKQLAEQQGERRQTQQQPEAAVTRHETDVAGREAVEAAAANATKEGETEANLKLRGQPEAAAKAIDKAGQAQAGQDEGLGTAVVDNGIKTIAHGPGDNLTV